MCIVGFFGKQSVIAIQWVNWFLAKLSEAYVKVHEPNCIIHNKLPHLPSAADQHPLYSGWLSIMALNHVATFSSLRYG